VQATIDPAQLDAWKKHIGRERIQREMLDVDVLRRFAAATGASKHVELNLPPMAHWAYFLDAVGDAELGVDGHPLKGDFLPPIHLPRRMFAAADVRFERALNLGKSAECVTRIMDVRHRTGASGELVFIELERQVIQSQTIRVQERQTLVYRGSGLPMAPIHPNAPIDASGQAWQPGPVELFRFSAVTFNAHRIHYDAAYAREMEGYPALVVHGPFTAIKLLNFAVDTSCRAVRSFSFRIVAPLFVSQPVRFAAGDARGSYVAKRCDESIAVAAKVEFHE
jgi:3-methylfumaryl-CoA hydratase